MADNISTSGYTSHEVNIMVGKSKISSIILVSLILCLVLLVVLLCVFLYKRWLRKKREEQQARLMKLFEPDEELEEELSVNNGLIL